MFRFGILVAFLFVMTGIWVVTRPPVDLSSGGVDRLANGAIIGAEVTRAVAPIAALPLPENGAGDLDLLRTTLTAILDGMGFAEGETLVETPPLAAMVIDGLRARQHDADIAFAIEAAYLAGEIEVPAALITVDGGVDSVTLLASVVVSAKHRLGEAVIEPISQTTSYIVVPGDSLGGIAMRVMGDVAAYPRLLEANSEILAHPAALVVGQQLEVPVY